MKRREFLTLIGGAAAWPLAAQAQQGGWMRRVGVLIVAYAQTDPEAQARTAAFLDTFQKLGWADGRNVRIEYRWGAGDADGGKAAALELVRSAPDVILVASNSALAEVRRLTSSIPIVFTQISDPVGGGFVAGLARPGGNVTGFQNFEPAMGGKWLGVLKEAAPDMSRAGGAVRLGYGRQRGIPARGGGGRAVARGQAVRHRRPSRRGDRARSGHVGQRT
jgi:putative tryptophan/tyrosine transport system substrate-binding protein